jgi:alpha(1,3/1,4) fucosyltransferase
MSRKINFKIITFIIIASLSVIAIGSNIISSKPTLTVKYINQWDGFSLEKLETLDDLLKEKYNIVNNQNTNEYDLVIDGVFGKEEITNNKAIKIFFTGEAIEPKLKNYDLSIGFSYNNQPNYIRIPLNYMKKGRNGKNLNSKNTRNGLCNPNKPFFACFLVSNGTTKSWLTGNEYDGVIKRDRLFHQLSLYKKVESAGTHLNNRGKILSKKDTQKFLSKCKFIIAYENQSFPGYITEKVFQAYDAGAIPLYYSDTDAVNDINKKSIVYSPNFTDEEDMLQYIKRIDQDNKLYCDIWNEKIITDPTRDYEAVKEELRRKLDIVLKPHLQN